MYQKQWLRLEHWVLHLNILWTWDLSFLCININQKKKKKRICICKKDSNWDLTPYLLIQPSIESPHMKNNIHNRMSIHKTNYCWGSAPCVTALVNLNIHVYVESPLVQSTTSSDHWHSTSCGSQDQAPYKQLATACQWKKCDAISTFHWQRRLARNHGRHSLLAQHSTSLVSMTELPGEGDSRAVMVEVYTLSRHRQKKPRNHNTFGVIRVALDPHWASQKGAASHEQIQEDLQWIKNSVRNPTNHSIDSGTADPIHDF